MSNSNKSSSNSGSGLSHKAMVWLGLTITRRPTPGACPPTEEIVAWHDGKLPSAKRRTIQSHVAQCESCYEAWIDLVGFDESAAVPAPADTRSLGYWSTITAFFMQPAFATMALVGIASLITLSFWQYSNTQGTFPGYEMELQGGAVVRGIHDMEGVYRYRSGHVFELMLTPETATDDSLDIALFARQDGVTTAINLPPFAISPAGAVLITGLVGDDIQLPPGQSRLFIAVSVTGRLPSAQVLQGRLMEQETAQGAAWSAWAVDVQLIE